MKESCDHGNLKLLLFIDRMIGKDFLKFCNERADVIGVFSESLDIMNLAEGMRIPFYATTHEYAKLLDYDVLFSVQYTKIIPENVINRAKRAFNLHLSLLPRNRGMYPAVWAILTGDEFHGATIHHLTEGLDKGDIVFQAKFPVGDARAKELHERAASEGLKLLKENFEKLISGDYVARKQDEAAATYHDRFSIDFQKEKYVDGSLPEVEIEKLLRAFYFPPYQKPSIVNGGHP